MSYKNNEKNGQRPLGGNPPNGQRPYFSRLQGRGVLIPAIRQRGIEVKQL